MLTNEIDESNLVDKDKNNVNFLGKRLKNI